MSQPTDPSFPRRDFLSQLATAGLAVAGAASVRPASATPAVPSGLAPDFDNSWTTRVAGAKHKAVFDSPEISDGLALFQARIYRDGYKEMLGVSDADVAPVIVIRHSAIVIALDDALWAKYGVGKMANVKDPKTSEFLTHNPYSRPHAGGADNTPGHFLEGLIASGVTVLACNLAAMRRAGMMAREAKLPVEQVQQEVRAGLIPGIKLQPSGIYASARAQEIGCVFMRST